MNPTAAELVVIGAGGHARVIADIVRLATRYSVVGYLDEVHPDRWGTQFGDSTILGGLDRLSPLALAGVRQAFVAVGDCRARLRLHQLLIDHGFDLPVLRHPSSVVANDVTIGNGTVIVAGAVVNPGSTLGRQVIVNTGASIDHDCRIDDGAHICPGVRLAGNVSVGRGAWVGIGAVVSNGLRIGEDSVIGAGAVVLDDIPPGVVAYGSPARIVRAVEGNNLAHR